MSPSEPARRRPRATPKGRQADPAAAAEIAALLGERPRRRDLLIEHLHLIQDGFGWISAPHLKALADEMRLSMAEVFEVASFYAHFDVVKEGEAPPPPLTVRVCASVACMMAGGEELVAALDKQVDPARIRVQRVPCLGACDQAPAATVDWRPVMKATPQTIAAAIADGRTQPDCPAYLDLAATRAAGGYAVLDQVRAGTRSIESVIAILSDAGLRGLGGAGFPAGRKWTAVRAEPAPRLMTINADEGEPGTFKDRALLEETPHRLLEGALIAAHAVEAERIYLYVRDEYPAARLVLGKVIGELEAAGLIAPGFIDLRRGAGAYICGEESAMIESIEGKRGLPRHRPPFIAQAGLFGRPTLNHNVETLAWVPDILRHGAAWFADQGMNGAKGLRSWSVSGRVKTPGVIVAPAGITALELIDRAGGMADGHAFRAYLPGGASGGILPARLADIPLDFGSLNDHGCFVGSHAVVILSDQDDMADIARNLLAFFEEESCGQCTPCRVGTGKALALMREQHWDRALLEELCAVMADASICGLGQAAPNPIRSILRFFAEEVA